MKKEQQDNSLLKFNAQFSSAEDDEALFLSTIKIAIEMINCDAGFLFIVDDDYLSLKSCIVSSKKIQKKGIDAEKLFPLVYLPDAKKTTKKTPSQISALNNEIINAENIYTYLDVNTQNIENFDAALKYNTNSLLSVPILGKDNEVLAVVELLNKLDEKQKITKFNANDVLVVTSLCTNLGLLLQNRQTSKQYSQLLESFIEVVAKAIDYKSPYTGVHCQRVPIITRMLTTAVIDDESPVFENFNLTQRDWYALHIASWLHDCGKVTTPEYILDKATKLETIYNRIHEIRNRFEILRRDAHIKYLQDLLDGKDSKENLEDIYKKTILELEEEFDHVAKCNIGDAPLTEDDIDTLNQIAQKTFVRNFSRVKGLSWAELNNIEDKEISEKPAKEFLLQNRSDQKYGNFNLSELYNLSISAGTINQEERAKINEHIIMTIDMLNSIPFPKDLKNIVEYAGGHHERVDGKGYPNGLTGAEMSIPTKIMAIADIFEALTSVDRPYKVPKKLSQVLSIMQDMKNTGHIDPDIYEVFIKSRVYLDYAEQYLRPEQIDEFSPEVYL